MGYPVLVSVVVALSLATPSFAQTTSPSAAVLAGVGDGGMKGIIGMESGDYSFVHFDQTQAMRILITEIAKRNEHDLKYFKDSVSTVNQIFESLVKDTIYGRISVGDFTYLDAGVEKTRKGISGGLKKLSDHSSQSGNAISIEDFLAAVNAYQEGRIALEVAIGRFATITDAFPSQVAVEVGGKVKTQVVGYGQINFKQVAEFYKEKLTQINTFVSNLPYQLLLANKTIHLIARNSGQGLSPNIPDFQISPAQLAQWKSEILKYRTWSGDAKRAAQGYTKKIREMIQRFIRTYGVEEKYRFDDLTPAKVEADLRDMTEYFYGRSYFRAIYGMPLGAIGIEYERKSFNTDYFFSSNSIKVFEEVVWNERERFNVAISYENAVKAAKARSQAVFGTDVNFFERINSALTLIKGQKRLAVANRMMLELLYNDFQEELLIWSGKYPEMRDHFRGRYQSSPEQIEFYSAMKNRYAQVMNSDTSSESDDPWGGSSGSGVISSGTVLAELQKVVMQAQVKEAEIATAEDLEAKIRLMTEIAQGQRNKRLQRTKKL